MYYQRFLPFLEKGLLIKNKIDTINVSDIYCPIISDKGIDNFENDLIFQDYMKNRVIKVLDVQPLGIKVFAETDAFSYYVKSKYDGTFMVADVTTINYGEVAKYIEMNGTNAEIKYGNAYEIVENVINPIFINNAVNGVQVALDNLSVLGIDMTIKMGEKISVFSMLEPTDSNQGVSEALDFQAELDKFEKGGMKKPTVKIQSDDFVFKWLNAYFQLPDGQDLINEKGDEVVPLLIGPTGVFKSATVKELCDKFGFRMVDFRVAFTSRLDYSGLYNKSGEYSYSCPMEELVTCSDGFREYCKRAIVKLKDILATGEMIVSRSSTGSEVQERKETLNSDQIKSLNKTLADYTHYLKTPVLFFDEITRTSDSGVENVLTQILNKKVFYGMTLKGCKFIAASNINFKYPEINAIYKVNEDLDTAYKNRFLSLKVVPEKIADRWLGWAESEKMLKTKDDTGNTITMGTGEFNIHPIIVEYLKKNPTLIYDETPVVEEYNKSGDDDTASATPFPNYRTWESVSKYIYTREKADKVLYPRIIEGLIGTKSGGYILTLLTTKYGFTSYVETDKSDDVGDFLFNNLDANIPAMMIGPSSLGKTARINAYCDKVEKETGKRPVLIDINLASMDAVDIMGMPSKKPLTQYIAKDTLKGTGFRQLQDDLANTVQEVMKTTNTGLVDTLTVRNPDSTYATLFKKALDEGRIAILFFDECTRVTNESMFSAVFEAISDSKIFGIDFSHMKDQVRIVSACNMGEGYTGVKGIDAALTARFSVYWKKEYDAKDAESFKTFLKSRVDAGEVDGIMYDYINEMEVGELLGNMKKVDQRALEGAEPSSRMLLQLSKHIKNMRGHKLPNGEYQASMWNGGALFNVVDRNNILKLAEELTYVDSDINAPVSTLRELIRSIKQKFPSWELAVVNKTIMFNGVEEPVKELFKMLLDGENIIINQMSIPGNEGKVKTALLFCQTIIDELNDADGAMVSVRTEVMESYVGPEFTVGFMPFFNDRFGSINDSNITIPMLEDIALINPYILQYNTSLSKVTIDDKIAAYVGQIDEFWDYWKDSIPAENCAEFFKNVFDILPISDNRRMLLSKLGLREDPFLAKAEQIGDTFIKDMVAKAFSTSISDEDLVRLKNASNPNSAQISQNRAKLI